MSERTASKVHAQTVGVAHGVASNTAFGAVVPPLYLSSTDEYGRVGNPTRNLLAGLEAGLSSC